MAYFSEVIIVRCSKSLYDKFNAEWPKNSELQGFSHAVRVAMIKYLRELSRMPNVTKKI